MSERGMRIKKFKGGGGAVGNGKVLSFLAGYAGLDLIEGYYKVFKKKKVKFK